MTQNRNIARRNHKKIVIFVTVLLFVASLSIHLIEIRKDPRVFITENNLIVDDEVFHHLIDRYPHKRVSYFYLFRMGERWNADR